MTTTYRTNAVSRVHMRHRGACARTPIPMCRASASVCRRLPCGCTTVAGAAMPLQGLRPYRKAVQCGGEAVDHQFAGRHSRYVRAIAYGTGHAAAGSADRARARLIHRERRSGSWCSGSLGCWKARPASPGFDLFPGPKPVEIVGPALCGTAVLSKTAADRCI